MLVWLSMHILQIILFLIGHLTRRTSILYHARWRFYQKYLKYILQNIVALKLMPIQDNLNNKNMADNPKIIFHHNYYNQIDCLFKSQPKPVLLSHRKQPFLSGLFSIFRFSSFLYFQIWFFCLVLCSFFWFNMASLFELIQGWKQRHVNFNCMVLDLNFPCKYVVFWCFTFQLFLPYLPFLILKQNREVGQIDYENGKQKANYRVW